MVMTEGVPVYRANWGKWKKVKSWGKQDSVCRGF